MKKTEIYTKEELKMFQDLEKQVEKWEYKPMEKKEFEKLKKQAQEIAKNTISKRTRKRSINIRLFENDIEKIKAIAFEKWIPYQTLISSVVHKLAIKEV